VRHLQSRIIVFDRNRTTECLKVGLSAFLYAIDALETGSHAAGARDWRQNNGLYFCLTRTDTPHLRQVLEACHLTQARRQYAVSSSSRVTLKRCACRWDPTSSDRDPAPSVRRTRGIGGRSRNGVGNRPACGPTTRRDLDSFRRVLE